MTKTMSIAGTTLELVERGDGRPLVFLHVFLHAGERLAPERVHGSNCCPGSIGLSRHGIRAMATLR